MLHSTEKHWFALYTKPRSEFKAELQLNSLPIETYLPSHVVQKKWSDRKKKITEPIFRDYIFIHADEQERLLALTQSAIVRCISFDHKPSIIPAWQIESLRKMLTEKPEVYINDKIEIGTKIIITEGPFSDVIGVVIETQEDKWLAVNVELIHRSVLVRLPKESAYKILND